MKGSQSLFVCGVAFIFICFTHAQCPENPQDALGNCLTGLGIGSTVGRSPNVLGEEDNQIKMLCSSNKMFQATNCMKKIIDDCENTKHEKQLEKLIDIKRWNETTKLLCNNIDYIIQNKGCMKKTRGSIQICIEKENLKFQASFLGMRGNSDQEKMINLTCGFLIKMLECMRESQQDSCPEKLLRIITDIFYEYTPPFCYDRLPKHQNGSYAVVKSGSVFMVCVAAVVALVSGFQNMI